MVKLDPVTPCDGLLPVAHGEVSLRELTPASITSVAPLSGAEKAVSTALKKAIGAGLPDVGRAVTGKTGEVLWTGQGQYFVLDGKVPKLKAAVTDQSDAWACVALEGGGATDVMARLCPLDFGAMDEGDVARSMVGHMMAVIVRRSDGYDLMVFRSMAGTLVHEMSTIMRSVAAQAALKG
ncbi:sarcosine oxidase subunit gamma [uncultured Litoreibacter sp.]|uniref:sarcosine oxidase subunit gamma n=1 Tax=uncultured Litoreibacter sp. TaxID=1392394 RepID=UPI00260ACEFE|nr:sarcosine oxidase subunit gamma [uncultured Litoreibacter sp.]